MRILIADKLASEGASYLEGQPDTEVTVRTGLAGDDLSEVLREQDGVVALLFERGRGRGVASGHIGLVALFPQPIGHRIEHEPIVVHQ